MNASPRHDPAPRPLHLSGADADLHALLVALVKLALADAAPEAAAWRADAHAGQRRVAAARAAIPAPRLDALWSLAVRAAESDPGVRRLETVNPTLPAMSPLSLAALAAAPFDLEVALQAIRDASSSG